MDRPEARLVESVNELLDGILLVHSNNLNIPALILLYAGIDFAASLDRHDPDSNVTRDDFLSWVEKYLLPGNDLRCSALDLYSARCGWVHTYTSKSRMVRSGEAKEIFYQFGEHDNEEQLQKSIKNPSVAVAVHFTKLFNAFRDGLDRWERDFLGNPKHLAKVTHNSEKLLYRVHSEDEQ